MACRNDLVVVGVGGHGKVAAGIACSIGVRLRGFLDDSLSRPQVFAGVPVLGTVEEFRSEVGDSVFIAIGNNLFRQRVVERMLLRGHQLNFHTLVHPRSCLAPSARVGVGSMLAMGAAVSEDVELGEHGIINTNASVDHDCVLGDFVHVACGATLAGGVHVGTGSLIGAGATILPGIRIGDWAVVGAGATVTKDVPEGQLVVGTPARPKR